MGGMTPNQRRDALTELEECYQTYAFDDTHLKQADREKKTATMYETLAMKEARLAVAGAHRRLHAARQEYAKTIKAGMDRLTGGR
jgi:hypothetical protein